MAVEGRKNNKTSKSVRKSDAVGNAGFSPTEKLCSNLRLGMAAHTVSKNHQMAGHICIRLVLAARRVNPKTVDPSTETFSILDNPCKFPYYNSKIIGDVGWCFVFL